MAPIALLLHVMDFSPDGGLLSAGRVVVVARVTVVVAAITATVESVELVAPPHDARPAMRRTARSLFMPLVYTTMVPKMRIELTTYLLRVFLIAAPWGGCNH
jgi:hypothetical protein